MDFSVVGLRAKRRKSGQVIFYWEPPPAARALSFQPRVMRRPDGSPMEQGEAVTAAQMLVNEWRELERTGNAADRKAARGRFRQGGGFDFSDLIRRYLASEQFKDLAEASQEGYRRELGHIEKMFGDIDVRVFTLNDARAYLKTIAKPSMRALRGTILRLLLSYACDDTVRFLETNPLIAQARGQRALQLPSLAPRVVECSYEAEAAMARSAMELDYPYIKLAIYAATCTGQREKDILAFTDAQVNEQGHHMVAQSKRKKAAVVVCIPFYLPRLQQALEEQRRRRHNDKVALLDKRWFLHPDTREPFGLSTFQRHFAEVRDHAAKTVPECAGIQFRDLRDTFITRCIEAECDPIGVMAITGHKPPQLPVTWRHYLKMKPSFARRALEKLMAYEAAQGVTMLDREA